MDKRTRTATNLLNISKSDLEASKYLLEGKHYCQSVFYLEQSIEIALKSWAIWHGIMTEEEVTKLRHEAWKIYLIMNEKFFHDIAILEKYPEFKEYTSGDWLNKYREVSIKEEQEKELHQELIERWKMSSSMEDLKQVLTTIQKIRDDWKTVEEALMKGKDGEISAFMSKIAGARMQGRNLPSKEELNTTMDEQFYRIKKMFQLHYFDFYPVLSWLFIVFYPHVSRSRYKFGRNKLNPLKYYTKALPLVQLLDKFLMITQQVLQGLQELYLQMS
ncbi:MAG: HEPN domain-containing protein [Nitrososphaeria archaeon]|jgi:HEPN domain-containing protein